MIYDNNLMIGTDYVSRRYYSGKFGGKLSVDMIQYLQMLLSMLNAVFYVIGEAQINRFSAFKIRYVTLYHVISSIRKLQGYFRTNGLLCAKSDSVFKEISSDETAKKMYKNKKFRNTLVHYRITENIAPNGSSNDAHGLVEVSFRGLTYGELDAEVCSKIGRSIDLLNNWMTESRQR